MYPLKQKKKPRYKKEGTTSTLDEWPLYEPSDFESDGENNGGSEGQDNEEEDDEIPGHHHIWLPGAAPQEKSIAFCLEARSNWIRTHPSRPGASALDQLKEMRSLERTFGRHKNWMMENPEETLNTPRVAEVEKPAGEGAGGEDGSPSKVYLWPKMTSLEEKIAKRMDSIGVSPKAREKEVAEAGAMVGAGVT